MSLYRAADATLPGSAEVGWKLESGLREL